MTPILAMRADESLAYAMRIAKECEPSFDDKTNHGLATAACKYYQSTKEERAGLRPFQDIENRWYRSLATGTPDFSVYGSHAMVAEVWACFSTYSRKYLLEMAKPPVQNAMRRAGQILSVADLGNGIGFTTASLKEIFPGAKVFGTNVGGSLQYKVGNKIGADRAFQVHDGDGLLAGPVTKVDLAFASEYFEHFQEPIEHLNRVVRALLPRTLWIANSFGSRSVGHFEQYLHQGKPLPNPVGKAFGARLRQLGYETVKTGAWNNRPQLWIRS